MKRDSAFGVLRRSAAGRIFDIGTMFEEAAGRHPATEVRLDRPLTAVASDRTRLTYAELAEIVDDLAARFREAGVRPGQYVAVHVDNGFDIPLLGCALARARAVPVMLAPALAPEIVRALVARLNDPWIVTNAARLALIAKDGGLPGVRAVLIDQAMGEAEGKAEGEVVELRGLAGAPRVRPGAPVPDAPALITHSSGTTGVPKLMVHTSRTLFHRLFPQRLMAWPVRRTEPILLAMSFVHSRFFNSLGVFLGFGNPLSVLSDMGLDTVRRAMVEFRPTVAETHPNNFVLWEELADEPDAPLASVKYYSATFDAIHPGTVKRLLAASRHRRPMLVQLYGQSETGPLSGWVSTKKNVERVDGRCIGYSLPGFIQIRVVDNEGRPVPRGTIGRLQVKSRARILTYLGEDERFRGQTAGRSGRWWYVTDMGWRDRAGRVFLADREVDRIGEIDSNLSLEDTLLDRLPEISEVVVVPDGTGLPTVVVATRGDRPLDAGRWEKAVADLPDLGAPVQWRFDDFPRTSTWKIRRLEMRELLNAGTGPAPISAPEQ